MRHAGFYNRVKYGMNTLASYVLFTGGILWYVIKYNYQYKSQNNKHITTSTFMKLNYWFFCIVSFLSYMSTALVAIFDNNIIEGITESTLLIISIGIIFDTYGIITAPENDSTTIKIDSVLPGKGYVAIIVAFTFFTFDPIRRKDETYFITIFVVWAICVLSFLVGSLSHFKHIGVRSTAKNNSLYTYSKNQVADLSDYLS